STSCGAKVINAGGGVMTVLTQDAMTHGPAIDFPSIVEAACAKAWITSPEGHGALKEYNRFMHWQRGQTTGRTSS
ncbi:hypothetical protein DFH07DRAFT_736358, partial [Mycena maculata]